MLKVYKNKKVERWFIFDFGGGTLDVAIVEVGNNTVRTIAVDGDNHLGGQDIDHLLMMEFLKLYREEYLEDNNGKEPNITPRLKARFKQAACFLKE